MRKLNVPYARFEIIHIQNSKTGKFSVNVVVT